MGERGVNIKRFRSDFPLFVRRHAFHGLHIVQPVRNFYDDYADVLIEGKQHFSEIFRLHGNIFRHIDMGNLGKPVHNAGHGSAKHTLDILQGIFSILNHVVQKGGSDAGSVQPNL